MRHDLAWMSNTRDYRRNGAILEPAQALSGAGRGKFADLPQPAAAVVLGTLIALVALGLIFAARAPTVPPPLHGVNGVTLYESIIERVRAGEPYETAAVRELRAQRGPLRPFVAVRPPALAMALALLPDRKWGDDSLRLLVVVTIGAWTVRLARYVSSPYELGAMALLLFAGIGPPLVSPGGMSLFHEVWGGLLIALSLALRTDRRFIAAATVGCLAAVVRELALPYLVVMSLIAFWERRRTESVAFTLALATALAALAWHAYSVMSLTTAGDASSPGWVAMAGWRFVLLATQWNLIVMVLGAWAAAIIVPLALAGAVGCPGSLGWRLGVLLCGYCLGFMVIGRLSNSYWGLVTAPIMAVAMCFAPRAVGDLARRALGYAT